MAYPSPWCRITYMDLSQHSAIELRDLFLAKQISALDIVKYFLNRIDKLNPSLNAFINIYPEMAIKRAQELDAKLASGSSMGLMAAIPVGIKDLINYKDTLTTAASKMLANHVSVYNATITQKILDADAIPLGKLNLDEFAMGSSNETSAYGPVKNPWNLSKVPGGSSGGSASAIAASMLPLAFGTDTGGSIRQPASYCGIVGMKPTYGRVSRYGIIAFASSLDQAGPMSRNVRDNALLMQVMAGYDPLDSTSLNLPVPNYLEYMESNFAQKQSLKGLRIGIAQDFFVKELNSELRLSIENAIKHYQSLGAELVDIKLDKIKYGLPAYYIIAPSEASSNLARYDGVRFGHRDLEAQNLSDLYMQSRSYFGAEVKRRIMLGVYALSSGYYEAYYKKAQQIRTLIARDFDQAFQACDLILTPTAPSTAFELGSKASDPLEMYLSDIMTVTVNLAGLPAISVNCAYDSSSMPIGMQLIGPSLSEDKIYNAAYAFESTSDIASKCLNPKVDELCSKN